MKIRVLSEISTGGEIIREGAIGEIQDNRVIFNLEDVEGIPAGMIPLWDSTNFLNSYVGQYTFTSESKEKEILPFNQFIREESKDDLAFKKHNLKTIERLRDTLTLLLNNPRSIGLIFEENPKTGEIGFKLVQHKEEADELVERTDFFNFRCNSPILSDKKVQSYDELKEYYDLAVRNKWEIKRYNEALDLAVGFIVRNIEGSTYYWAHISALKKKN